MPAESARPAPLLEVSGVGITHDGSAITAPIDLDLAIRPGEVVLILGPSGSGKSTLALALNGLIPHAVPAQLDGEVRIAGVSTLDLTVAEVAATVGMVFQDPDAQIVTGTLLDEVAFGPENLLVPVAEVLERSERALRQVGLWERRDENPDRLSGGGRQRLAIACALALGSPVLVLDEPTANLDPAGVEEVYEVLGRLVEDGTRSIVLIEHNLDAAMGIVDRVLVLGQDGRPVALGTVDEVLRERAAELHLLGVWLPVAALAALQLREAGVDIAPLPLSAPELADRLDAIDSLPQPLSAERSAERSAPIIEVRALTVARTGRVLLDSIDLTVARGDFLAVVGTNGAGKTTLLQRIAGVVKPPRGTVVIDGLDPAHADVRTLASTVGFVFQNPEHQFIEPTVADELAHGLRIRGLDDDEVAHRVDAMLTRFGLSHLREQHPFLLSGGQKRRLSVGTALITGATVLALDEPTFGQDRSRATELLDLLDELQESGSTILIVTHDLQLVAEHADRVAVMADGRLLGEGPTGEILGGDLIDAGGLRRPPLATAMGALGRHPDWHRVSRLADLPRIASGARS